MKKRVVCPFMLKTTVYKRKVVHLEMPTLFNSKILEND
jgi:hypothetical protein